MCIITSTSNAFPHENNGTRVFLENNHYPMSVSLHFERGHWNIPIGGFKLPPSELRNTKIKHAATPKTAGTRINTKHTPSHKEITNAHEFALPSIIADSQCLRAASRHMQYMADRRLTAMLPYRTWCQASTVRAAVRHTAAGQQLVWRPVCLASLRANGDTDARHSPERRTREEEAVSNLSWLPCQADDCFVFDAPEQPLSWLQTIFCTTCTEEASQQFAKIRHFPVKCPCALRHVRVQSRVIVQPPSTRFSWWDHY